MFNVATAVLGAMLLLLATLAPVRADTYPSKPIMMISWSAAGSPVDVMARQIAKLAPKYLGQPMFVQDKTGADGGNALNYLVDANSDGYTLMVLTNTIAVILNTSLKDTFKREQFAFPGALETDPYVIAVRSESPIKTFADFVKATKTQANFSLGGPFAQSAESFFAGTMADAVKITFNWVPFNGGGPTVTAALGGHVDAVCTNVSAVSSLVRSGQMRALAVSGKHLNAQLPDTPTFAALGYRQLTSTHWRGVMTRAGLPSDVSARLQTFLAQVAQDPEFNAYLNQAGLLPFYRDNRGTEKLVTQEMERVRRQLAARQK